LNREQFGDNTQVKYKERILDAIDQSGPNLREKGAILAGVKGFYSQLISKWRSCNVRRVAWKGWRPKNEGPKIAPERQTS